ncbi:MAG: hypothetical protein ABR926_06185 [Streptosporangiaceae bacterium]|jgi:hypothetical protein
MTEPMPLPAAPAAPAARAAAGIRRGVVACLAVAAGTVLLGLVAGFVWAVAAPRPLLVMTGRGAAAVINAETGAFIAADGWYCFICLAAGLLSGLFGYLLAVRSYGPVAMIMVLVSAVAAALITLWIGEHVGLASYHHLLATLPPGARLRAALSLGARSAIAFWPLGAGLMAGGMELAAWVRDRRVAASGSALAQE